MTRVLTGNGTKSGLVWPEYTRMGSFMGTNGRIFTSTEVFYALDLSFRPLSKNYFTLIDSLRASVPAA